PRAQADDGGDGDAAQEQPGSAGGQPVEGEDGGLRGGPVGVQHVQPGPGEGGGGLLQQRLDRADLGQREDRDDHQVGGVGAEGLGAAAPFGGGGAQGGAAAVGAGLHPVRQPGGALGARRGALAGGGLRGDLLGRPPAAQHQHQRAGRGERGHHVGQLRRQVVGGGELGEGEDHSDEQR